MRCAPARQLLRDGCSPLVRVRAGRHGPRARGDTRAWCGCCPPAARRPRRRQGWRSFRLPDCGSLRVQSRLLRSLQLPLRRSISAGERTPRRVELDERAGELVGATDQVTDHRGGERDREHLHGKATAECDGQRREQDQEEEDDTRRPGVRGSNGLCTTVETVTKEMTRWTSASAMSCVSGRRSQRRMISTLDLSEPLDLLRRGRTGSFVRRALRWVVKTVRNPTS